MASPASQGQAASQHAQPSLPVDPRACYPEHVREYSRMRESMLPSMTAGPKHSQATFSKDDAESSAGGTSCNSLDSTLSYQSVRDIANFIREVNGRHFNSQNHRYFLPADNIEYSRLDKQHLMSLLALGGLYPAPNLVETVLEPNPTGERRKILDLGCGTGAWCISMAQQYPHADVLGVDLAPCPINEVPANCRFELDDINPGLGHFHEQFDFVHVRCVAAGMVSFRSMMNEAIRCVKPGGAIVIMDGDYELVKQDMVTMQDMASHVNPEGSWLRRFYHETRYAQSINGGDILGADLYLDQGLWYHPQMDQESCGTGSIYHPVGPWAKSPDFDEAQRLTFAGTAVRQNMKEWTRANHQLFLQLGFPPYTIDKWTGLVDDELDSMDFRDWLRFRFAYGRKMVYKDDEEEETPDAEAETNSKDGDTPKPSTEEEEEKSTGEDQSDLDPNANLHPTRPMVPVSPPAPKERAYGHPPPVSPAPADWKPPPTADMYDYTSAGTMVRYPPLPNVLANVQPPLATNYYPQVHNYPSESLAREWLAWRAQERGKIQKFVPVPLCVKLRQGRPLNPEDFE